MKNLILISIIIVMSAALTIEIIAQTYCTPGVGTNFGHGITNFTINGTPSINRSSSPNEGYINTGLSTTLKRDSTYTVIINFSYGTFCNYANLRIWIDYNGDGDFFDTGEMVVDVLNLSGTTSVARFFTIPSSAVPGLSRMRVTEKMTQSCGHTLPDPCNDPPDPLGYHGEYEDYDVTIAGITSIKTLGNESPQEFSLYQNYPNPFNPTTKIRFALPPSARGSFAKLAVYDALGREVVTLVNEQLKPGTYEVDWDGSSYVSGVYYYKLIAGDYIDTKKMILIK